MAEWPVLTLKDAGISLIDCVHKTPQAAAVGLPYVSIPEMKSGRLDLDAARRISEADFAEWTKKALPQGHDVVLSRRCNPGETAAVEPGVRFAVGQNLVLLRADGFLVYPPFLRWLVRGPDWRNQIQTFLNVGAVFDSLRCADVPNFQLPIPPIDEQRAIASVLGSLDDKIELNRRMNRTLEQMAQAYFKAWFVDFEPVRAKASGAASFAGMPQPVFDTLPTTFADSELGPIPEGWEVGRLENLVVLQRGYDLPKQSRTEGSFPVIASGGLNGTHGEFKVAGPGVATGRSGVLGNVYLVQTDFWPLNTTLWVKEYGRSSPYHAYFLLRTLDLAVFNAGSAVPTLNRNHIHGLRQVLPPSELVFAFDSVVRLLFDRLRLSTEECVTLAETRDALLPKLLSGEVRVTLQSDHAMGVT